MKDELLAKARELGFSNLGVASATQKPHWEFYASWLERGFAGEMSYLADHLALKESATNLLPDARSVIMVSLDYNQAVPARAGFPRIARYAQGRDYHKVIRGKLRRLVKFMDERMPGGYFRICVDSAPLLEREFASMAGLGWFGKNTCLIDSRRGSWFLLGALITSIELEPDTPASGNCGTCNRCVEACPTAAIVFDEGRWQVDSRRCISYLTIEKKGELDPELAAKIGDWTFGCDVCQEVCPFNATRKSQPLRGAPVSEPELLPRRNWPNLTQLSQISEEDWDELTRGSAVRRTGAEGLRRNALQNRRNIPDSDS